MRARTACQQPFRLQASSLQQAPGRRLASTPPRGQVLQVRAGLHDPWDTLGVSHSASEKEIKKAHRQLVKQHHPDVRSNDPKAHARFISIQEAYELVMGKRAGKDIDSRPSNQSGWNFHDWYWSFGIRRRAKASAGTAGTAGTAGAAAEPPPPPPPREQWEAQMAGLKQKAAAKRSGGGRRQRAAAGAGTAFGVGGAEAAAASASSSAAAAAAASDLEKEQRESVWRSMTKNARNSDKAAAAAAAAAGAQTLGSTGAAARSAAVGAGSQALPLEETPMHAAPVAAAAAAQEPQPPLQHASTSASTEQLHSMHSSSGAEQGAASDASHTPPHHHAPTTGSQAPTHAQRLQQLMSRAAGMVHDARREAEGAAHAHSQRLGAHLRSPPTLEHLATLLGGRHSAREHERSSSSNSGGGGSGSGGTTQGNAVAADAQLHHRFEASRRRMAERQQAVAAVHAAAAPHADVASGAALVGQHAGQHAEQRVQHASGLQLQGQAIEGEEALEGQHVGEQFSASAADAHHTASQARHARKFANRDEVEGRLTTQLAGLKRRAAIKHEVESSC